MFHPNSIPAIFLRGVWDPESLVEHSEEQDHFSYYFSIQITIVPYYKLTRTAAYFFILTLPKRFSVWLEIVFTVQSIQAQEKT